MDCSEDVRIGITWEWACRNFGGDSNIYLPSLAQVPQEHRHGLYFIFY